MHLIEVYVPEKHFEKTDEKLRSFSHKSYWVLKQSDGRRLIRIIVGGKEVEQVLDYFEEVSNVVEGFETLLIPLKSYLSRETIREEAEGTSEQEKDQEDEANIVRASRHELIHTIDQNSFITWNYSLLIIFSAVVATMGFMKNSEAVVIGAMVIAPMIGPVIAIAFSSILGDYRKLWKSMVTSFIGFFIVVGIAIFFTYFFGEALETDQYLARTEVEMSDFILALASGGAGALSVLNRMSGNLVGVMVAVALLPPSLSVGIGIGQGEWERAWNAFLLTSVNVNCILLAAILVFILSGIRPVRWQKVSKANVSRVLSVIFVGGIVAVLIAVIVLTQNIQFE
ncbi:TIGR00341 family protein [Salirhabdus salicampi]|uniref:TIGR00341 family protein n=1 Tax=Salirhabdus salicampi TaxID=476102 RepID=UPI0020C5ABC3|nr:TIGR00341 family protein [Salirhabdus salicampi]MCP8615315.1 TIGR00341 family protein [Salirhabdus salicampi]